MKTLFGTPLRSAATWLAGAGVVAFMLLSATRQPAVEKTPAVRTPARHATSPAASPNLGAAPAAAAHGAASAEIRRDRPTPGNSARAGHSTVATVTSSSRDKRTLHEVRQQPKSPASEHNVEATALHVSSQEPENAAPPETLTVIPPQVIVNAPLPVALAVPDLTGSDFSPQEQSAVQNARDSFAAAMAAAPTQDPENPAYFSYWKSAAYLHDEQLRLTLGWASFNRLSALAAQAAERAR